jgi:hydrogenase expression/formation protein HypC
MCLGVPGQVVEVHGNDAVVDFWGTRKQVKLEVLKETVMPGDYIVDHAGYAIRRIAPAEVADTLAMYEVVLCEAGEDPLEQLDRERDLDFELV